MQIPCINKQRWNKDKSRCKCKESIGKEICDKVFIQNLVILIVNVIEDIYIMKIGSVEKIS